MRFALEWKRRRRHSDSTKVRHFSMRVRIRGCLLSLILAAASGCSSGDGSLAEVTGRVTLNGLPAEAEILFQPQDEEGRPRGRASSAFSDEEGRFQLSYSADRTGAEIGRHRVSVKILETRAPGDGRTDRRAMIPLKSAEFTRIVQSGENHFHFAMSY